MSEGGGSNTSPFVLSAALHGVKAVPSIINAVILMSVTSVASSSLYSASRTLQSLAEQGFAPTWFNYIDRAGRPTRALLVSAIIGLFAFIAAYKSKLLSLIGFWLFLGCHKCLPGVVSVFLMLDLDKH